MVNLEALETPLSTSPSQGNDGGPGSGSEPNRISGGGGGGASAVVGTATT
jgi:hypothetical protein